MQAGDREAGQTGQAALAVDQDAEHQDGGEQQQRHDAGGAAGVPERGGPAHHVFLSCRPGFLSSRSSIFGDRARRILQVSSALASERPARVVTGQPATVNTAPVASTRRAGRPRLASQPSARRPRMIAAVLAALASAQVPAVTDTVRQTGSAGGRCAGQGCDAARRRRVASGARPCWRWPGHRHGSRPARTGPPADRRVRRSRPEPGSASRRPGAGPATAMSPPRLTSTPQPSLAAIRAADRSAAQAFAVAPRSSWTPSGMVSGLAVQADLAPARHGPDGEAERRAVRLYLFEITIVS